MNKPIKIILTIFIITIFVFSLFTKGKDSHIYWRGGEGDPIKRFLLSNNGRLKWGGKILLFLMVVGFLVSIWLFT